jgi:1,4-alpha-glucan branching enzyme
MPAGNANDSLYFSDKSHAGGRLFAHWNSDVQHFLRDIVLFFLSEYRIDGILYDQIGFVAANGGDQFCRQLSQTVRQLHPHSIQIAEAWEYSRQHVVQDAPSGGLGFDAVFDDQLRSAVRSSLADAVGGATAHVNLDRVRDAIQAPLLSGRAWRRLSYLENYDLVYRGYEARIPAAADPGNARSWYARSRARVATGLLLTTPGLPVLFMGEEFLEDKQWTESMRLNPNEIDVHGQDFQGFVTELLTLRRRTRSLRADHVNVFYVSNQDRIIAFHRWNEGLPEEAVVVLSLNESNLYQYEIGFPKDGLWTEVFSSARFERSDESSGISNSSIMASSRPLHGLAHSGCIAIPANSIIIFIKYPESTQFRVKKGKKK